MNKKIVVRLLIKYDSLLPAIAILVVIFGVVLNSIQGNSVNYNGFTNPQLFEWIGVAPVWLLQSLSGLIAIGVAFSLNRLVQVESLLGRISNMPLFIISLLFVLLPASYNHPLFWIGCMFQILLIRQTLDVLSGEKVLREAFSQGLIIGGLGIISPSFLLYYFVSIRAFILSARFNVRVALIVLVAMIVPLYILNGIFYLFSQDLVFYSFSFDGDWHFGDTFEFIKAGVLFLILGIAFVQSRAQLSKATMREKRQWSLITMTLLIGTVSFISFNYGYWLFALIIPFAIALARTLMYMKNRWLAELFFILVLGLIYLFKIDG